MKKIIFTLLMTVAALAVTAQTNRVYIDNFSIEPGETKTVTVNFDNETSFCSVQWHMLLPEGLNIETKDNGKPKVTINPDRSDEHTVTSGFKDGGVQVTIYSGENLTFPGNSGAFLTFNVTADADIAAGDHELIVENVVASTPAEEKYRPDGCTTIVSVVGPTVAESLVAGNLHIPAGLKIQLEAVVVPAAASSQLSWSSSDEAIATVDENGLVSTKSEGEVVITAATGDGSNLSLDFVVNVTPAQINYDLNQDGFVNVGDVGALYTAILAGF